jgi:gluconate:H+ symporter, GntP family
MLAAAHHAGSAQLVTAALLGIAVVVVLISVAKVHPFVALVLGSAVLGVIGGLGAAATVDSFTQGVGSTVGSVGLLIALGSMIGALLADSGGADEIVDTVVRSVSARGLPWALVGVAALVGLPLFFEVGVVLLVPVVLLTARRTGASLMRLGIPALAGLSVLHGLVPPHPGPLAAIAVLKADLGLTLLLGLIVAVPTAVIAGPLFAGLISRYVRAEPPVELIGGVRDRDADRLDADRRDADVRAAGAVVPRRPAFTPVLLTALLPIVLMLARAIGELTLGSGSTLRSALDVAGNPVVALLAGVLVAMVTLGYALGRGRTGVSASLAGALPPIAGILLIVAAGGGFKQLLVDSGISGLVADAAKGASLSPLVLGWLVAVGIRLATGSATVATITAAGIVAPLAAGLDQPTVALLALAVGAGSLFFSHVNDAGFWLVKEYFGMTVGETIKSWSIMETLISVVGLIGVLVLSVVV